MDLRTPRVLFNDNAAKVFVIFMSNKKVLFSLFADNGLPCRKDETYRGFASEYEKHPEVLSLNEIRRTFRSHWTPCNIGLHINHLKSGLLQGHDWHGAMPSILHKCIQDKVRECSEGKLTLEDYLNVCGDISKHEYFMVAIHDICESSIILSDEDVIPPIADKSVTDFIYNNIPYDLKVTTHPVEWRDKAGSLTLEDKKQLATELYENADIERLRKAALKCRHNWGLDRMYYLVSDQNLWLSEPEKAISFLLNQMAIPDNHFIINVKWFDINICLVER